MKHVTGIVLIATALIFSTAHTQQIWKECTLPVTTGIDAVAIGPQGTVYAGARGLGVFRSTDNGTTWELNGEGLTNTLITDLAVTTTGTLYAATDAESPLKGSIFRSTDNGETWEEVAEGLAGSSITSLAVGHDNIIYAGGYRQPETATNIYRLNSSGRMWEGVTIGETDVQALTVTSDGTLYAGTSIGTPVNGIFRSTDNGETWTLQSNGLDYAGIEALGSNASGTIVYAGTFNHFPDADNVYRSTNSGEMWDTAGLKNTRITAIAVDSDNVVYAGTNGSGWPGGFSLQGVYRSRDNGDSWEALNQGLTYRKVTALAIGTNHLFAGTIGGLFRLDRQVSSVTAGRAELNITASLTISRFPSTGIIHLALTRKTNLTVSILNTLGETVAVPMINQSVHAGTSAHPIDLSRLPGGIWFVTLTTEEHTQTLPLVLVQ